MTFIAYNFPKPLTRYTLENPPDPTHLIISKFLR